MSANGELSRPVRIDTLGAQGRRIDLEANETERAALAERFGLVSIQRLSAEAEVTRSGERITGRGRLSAAVTQSCVATGEPVEAVVEEDFSLEFRPEPKDGASDEEIELSGGELDVIFYNGAAVDVGEAVAETLSLSLDPFPRSPAAESALKEAGVKSEEEARAESSPFAALAALKDKLKP